MDLSRLKLKCKKHLEEQMSRPQFPTLNRLAHGCINLKRDSMNINAQDARAIANEYTKLLEYITELQDTIISIKNNDVITVEIDNGTF